MSNKMITGLVVVGGLAALYFLVIKPKTFNKDRAIDTIISKGYYSSGRANLESFDDDFILAWGSAAKSNSQTFVFGGKTYKTQGGKVEK
jgi:hypothetical protein